MTYLATGDKFGTIGYLVEKGKALYPFILHFDGFWGIEEEYFNKYDDLIISTHPEAIFFMNLG